LDRSGSHRFADHIYRGVPSGRGPFGRWLDARLLALPATQALRFRYSAVRDALTGFLLERLADPADPAVIDVLSVPCGIPRELADAAAAVRARASECREVGERMDRVVFHGLDLDPEVLDEARAFAAARGLRGFETHLGDALERASYPSAADFIGCTGLGDFLDDGALGRLYAVLFDVLRPGGVLVTSGMERRRGADYLLRLAEIRTRYRSAAELVRLVERLPFREVTARRDGTGIQTVVTARR
jgi:SAM-dependent methyltransferase